MTLGVDMYESVRGLGAAEILLTVNINAKKVFGHMSYDDDPPRFLALILCWNEKITSSFQNHPLSFRIHGTVVLERYFHSTNTIQHQLK